jgi:hypothetical protein
MVLFEENELVSMPSAAAPRIEGVSDADVRDGTCTVKILKEFSTYNTTTAKNCDAKT